MPYRETRRATPSSARIPAPSRRRGLIATSLAILLVVFAIGARPAMADDASRSNRLMSAVAEAAPTPASDNACSECDLIHAASRTAVAGRRDAARQEQGVVRAVLFWSETCPHCHHVINESLPPIQAEYGDKLEVILVNVSQRPGYEAWVAAMDARAIPSEWQVVPMLFVGDEILTGSVQIPEELPGIVDRYLVEGGRDLPEDLRASLAAVEATPTATPRPTPGGAAGGMVGPAEPPAIHAIYFYQPGCDVCDRAEYELRHITDKYPQLVIERYDVRADAALNQYLCDRYGVPADKHLTAPALFLSSGYLLDDAIRAPAIEVLVEALLASGGPNPAAGWDGHQEAAVETIVERFRSFGLLTVVGAGLLDGVNPCAFATMIFLISYLSLRKRTGGALLATGGAFTLGVFLTYLGVGFGFLRFLGSLPFLHVIGKWIYGVTALMCIALAVGSILDYRKAREGKLEEMSLKLPARLRNLSKRLIRERASAERFVLSAFLLGFGVSVIELACTGQVYLPTIIFVLGLPEWRTQAGLLLVIYNLMFILPLVGVFLLVYLGTTSQQLIDWMTKHTAGVKLGTAALFLLLAGWLSYSIIYL